MLVFNDHVGGIIRDWFWHPTQGIYVRRDNFQLATWIILLYSLLLAVFLLLSYLYRCGYRRTQGGRATLGHAMETRCRHGHHQGIADTASSCPCLV